ncbi:hypothetical protein EJC49_21470 [Aquibium carbonis]|uniref:Uncharacterized protein n=1 Tax=Aquibium carbonis TaxID=2495581 RepID=A0A3R9ZP29_9HYPH|nr:hypothetical protein [Aquibium carbonis]RST84320.1 hypothetical protein EJC49_21470 [Aquibium carbonis]
MRFPSRLAVAAASLLLVSGTSFAQTGNPAWLEQLELQIASEEQCEVGFYIYVNEEKLGGRTVQEARAQCVDGRQFDASRTEPDSRFTISECGTRVC